MEGCEQLIRTSQCVSGDSVHFPPPGQVVYVCVCHCVCVCVCVRARARVQFFFFWTTEYFAQELGYRDGVSLIYFFFCLFL